ncbi:phosphate ABC transporter ATP-binding protein [Candidatus Poribacteria bacterium]|nr:phosphate ABC transporter ATP-binding protein [Candidatus Poribacteria bacterium]MYG09154.1 phosphate ABC transporter ATP-binding protein [Candidatus Poribacteria bacterium]MYK24397.1 phosphate ABC transporter ATP-binding protein [Candidatus Poribacteria bacterium]
MLTEEKQPILSIRDLNIWYGDKQILRDLSFEVQQRQVTAFIGPTNCGKSTLVRCINRLNDFTPNFRSIGEILFKGSHLHEASDATALRKQIGMVFRKPTLFRCSIYENVAYGAQIAGVNQSEHLDIIVEKNLQKTGLWDEVEDILDETPEQLSTGQQQLLCIARALAVDPEVLIFDEPCGELDPIETVKIETLVRDLTNEYTLIFATNKRRQAARVSDVAGFLYGGELIEFGATEKIFTNPQDNRTEQYVTGRLG